MKFTTTTLTSSIALTTTMMMSTTSSDVSAFSPFDRPTRSKINEQNMKNGPKLSAPKALDGTMAGDYQFDPLSFASNAQDLELYREAEIRHARLAMLAAVGWPLSELWQPTIASTVQEPSLIDPSTDLAPAVLNGNISDINPLFFVGALVLGSMIEARTIDQKKQGTYEPKFIGDIGFDPLNLYPKENDPEAQRSVQAAEVNNGRIAMLAITSFAFQEFTNNVGVVDATPQFF